MSEEYSFGSYNVENNTDRHRKTNRNWLKYTEISILIFLLLQI